MWGNPIQAVGATDYRVPVAASLLIGQATRHAAIAAPAGFALRSAPGLGWHIAVTTFSLSCFYTVFLCELPRFEHALGANFVISPIIISFFAIVLGPVILRSGLPSVLFGLQTANWKSASAFSILASLAFIVVAVSVKWLLIRTTTVFANLSIVGFADLRANDQEIVISPLYVLAVVLYLVLTPIQEFVARCCLQAPLQAVLPGSNLKRRLLSILLSNLLFAGAHLHFSLAFALAAFVPGIFWGWIFARTNSLLAAAVSHFLIGGAGIFLFGIEDLIAALTS